MRALDSPGGGEYLVFTVKDIQMTLSDLARAAHSTEENVSAKVLNLYRADPSRAVDFVALHAPLRLSDRAARDAARALVRALVDAAE